MGSDAPRIVSAGSGDLGGKLESFRNPRLWLIMATPPLIIGATFATFSYFTPILTDVAGFSERVVPLLLLGYGVVTVVGNIIVARVAQTHTIPVIVAGFFFDVVFLVDFGTLDDLPAVAVIAVAGISLAGITLNPAMITRIQQTGGTGSLVQTPHSSFITLGIVIGSWLGGLGTDAYGFRAPLWVGASLALLAPLAIAPVSVAALRTAADPSASTAASVAADR